MGSFDGVHLGHADVIRRIVAAAGQVEAQPALITFEPHPRCVLDPANCPQSITTLQEKLTLLETAGIEHAIVLTFDAGTPPVVKLQTGPAAVMFAIVFETICQ